MARITKGYEVFIASTLGDLEEEREAVARRVTDSGNSPILMERFPSSTGRHEDVIKSAIDHAEIIILIIGSRYGALIREEGSSYTDYEYEYAVSLNKPIIVFMLSEERLQEELNKAEKDRRNKIREFRDKIKAARQVFYFRDTEDLSVKFNTALRVMIGQQCIIPIGNTIIDLNYETNSSLENVISKLQVLNSIYLRLCKLVGTSAIDYPLTIRNLKTGSLWIRLFGESKIISLIVQLIRTAISYIDRNLTVEGKIDQIPRKVETLDTFLDLSKKLEEGGFDTRELNDNLNDAALGLAKDLKALFENTKDLKAFHETTPVYGPNIERKTIRKIENDITKGSK